jgi:hypothetical protein
MVNPPSAVFRKVPRETARELEYVSGLAGDRHGSFLAPKCEAKCEKAKQPYRCTCTGEEVGSFH